jgi:hypothetical protein
VIVTHRDTHFFNLSAVGNYATKLYKYQNVTNMHGKRFGILVAVTKWCDFNAMGHENPIRGREV